MVDNHPHEDELPPGKWPKDVLVAPPDPDNMGISPLLMLEELRKWEPEIPDHSDI